MLEYLPRDFNIKGELYQWKFSMSVLSQVGYRLSIGNKGLNKGIDIFKKHSLIADDNVPLA